MTELRCNPATTFRASVTSGERKVFREDTDGSRTFLEPAPSASISSEPFEWGIDSPGADQLSFALLREVLGEAAAASLFVDFKFDVVADLFDDWSMTAADIAEWEQGYSKD